MRWHKRFSRWRRQTHSASQRSADDLCPVNRPNRRRRGVAIVWIAFLLMALVLLVGLGLDGARLYMDAHQLQNAG